jgi:tetratricopeptide (TPR) repeat protein
MQAQTDLFSGRTRSALRILEKGLEEDRRLGYPILEVDKRLTKAALYLLVGDKAAAAAECRLVPLLEADNPRLMFLGEILARSGTMEAAALVADRIEKAKSSSLSAFYASVVRGEIELASGRATEAIRIAQAAAKTHPGTAVRELLARSYAASGHFDQAEAEYRSLSERRGEVLFPTDRLWFSPRWPEVLFGYADCLRRQGRNQDARQQFRSFLWAFDGADPEIPRIAEARSFLRKPR